MVDAHVDDIAEGLKQSNWGERQEKTQNLAISITAIIVKAAALLSVIIIIICTYIQKIVRVIIACGETIVG